MPEANVAISLKNISKHYRLYSDPKDRLKEALNPFRRTYHKKHEALCDIDLTINKGDVIGIVGRNGCGKSTLLKLITKVLQPNQGTIYVDGKITALLELGAGFNPEFSGIDNIKFYAGLLGLSAEEIDQKLDAIIEFAELGDYLNQPVKTYSSGMQARLGFSVAAHIDPDILILDEVLAVGDALFRRKCYAKMEEFFQSGKTIVYVSHDANSVNQLCNRAILLYEGRIKLDGEPSMVTKHYEKLLFTNDSSCDGVKGHQGSSKERTAASVDLAADTSDKVPADTVTEVSRKAKLQPYFIPGFIPTSHISYPTKGAKISNSRVTTLDGETVNVLVSGERYQYRYDVKFEESWDLISFGMQIKDVKGMTLTGASGYLSNSLIEIIDPRELVSVSWEFDCNLLRGEYYTNAGVSYEGGGQSQFLAREVDNLAFKVVTDPLCWSKGIVDLNQSCSLKQGDKELI